MKPRVTQLGPAPSIAGGARPPSGLETTLQYVKGVGPQRARLLERLGLLTVRDALDAFPRDYQDRSALVPFARLRAGDVGVVGGTVFGVAPPPRGRSRAPVQVTFRDAAGYFTALWFGQPYLARVFQRGQRVVLYGKVTARDRRLVFQSPDFEILEEDELGTGSIHMGRIVPVYGLTEGLTQRPMRTLLHRVVEEHAGQVADALPESIRRRHGLPSAPDAYRAIHFPGSMEAAETARRRFVFEDFLLLQLGLTIRRRRHGARAGHVIAPPGRLVGRLLDALPFELTPAQRRVWEEIRGDLARSVPFWPLGLPGWTDEWLALGMRAPDGRGPTYVSVWQRGGEPEVRLPVRHLAGTDLSVRAEVLYPSPARTDSAASWDPTTGELWVSVPRAPGVLLVRLTAEARTGA